MSAAERAGSGRRGHFPVGRCQGLSRLFPSRGAKGCLHNSPLHHREGKRGEGLGSMDVTEQHDPLLHPAPKHTLYTVYLIPPPPCQEDTARTRRHTHTHTPLYTFDPHYSRFLYLQIHLLRKTYNLKINIHSTVVVTHRHVRDFPR